jgi:hypothetical protein
MGDASTVGRSAFIVRTPVVCGITLLLYIKRCHHGSQDFQSRHTPKLSILVD